MPRNAAAPPVGVSAIAGMAGAFAAAGAVAAAMLVLFGRGWNGIAAATVMAARVAFVFFWLAYAGGALAAWFGPAFDGLARRRREFGLAFAAALFVHLCFVAWLFQVSLRPPVPRSVVFYFGVGAALTYALALASIPSVRGLVDARLWRVCTAVAMEYIACLFFRDFALLPMWYRVPHPITLYAPFAALLVVGALLRWTALLRRWAEATRLDGAPR